MFFLSLVIIMLLCLFAGEDLMRDEIIGGGDEMVQLQVIAGNW